MAKKILRVTRGNEFTLSLSLLRRIIVTGGGRDEAYVPTSALRLVLLKVGYEPYPSGGCDGGCCQDGMCGIGGKDCGCGTGSCGSCGDKGCDFPLEFYYGEEDVTSISPYPAPSPLAGCDPRVEIEITDFTVSGNVVTFNVPPTLPCGVYRFMISDVAPDGKAMRAVLGDIFEITEVEIIDDSDDGNAGVETGYNYVVYDLGSVTFLGQDAPTRAQFEALQTTVSEGLASVNERIDEIVTTTVQSDWAENDPDSPAYIRNRTHYRGDDTTSWNGTASLTGGYGWCQGNINITTGERYDVVFTVSGGSTFVYRGLRPRTDDDGNFYLSKDWIITASPMSADGEDAWYVWNVDGTVYLGVSFLQNVEIDVAVTNADVKTLDEQYVPDSIPMKISQQELTAIINS